MCMWQLLSPELPPWHRLGDTLLSQTPWPLADPVPCPRAQFCNSQGLPAPQYGTDQSTMVQAFWKKWTGDGLSSRPCLLVGNMLLVFVAVMSCFLFAHSRFDSTRAWTFFRAWGTCEEGSRALVKGPFKNPPSSSSAGVKPVASLTAEFKAKHSSRMNRSQFLCLSPT